MPNETRQTELRAAECDAFTRLVNEVLDGSSTAHALKCEHTISCGRCAALASAALEVLKYSAQQQQFSPQASPKLTDQIAAASSLQFQRRRIWKRVTVGAGLALAASIVLVIGLSLRPEEPKADRVLAVVTPPPPPKAKAEVTPQIGEKLSDAGQAIIKLAQQTSETATAPTKPLWEMELKLPALSAKKPELPTLSTAANEGFDPVTSTTKRAVNLFLRDYGIAPVKTPPQTGKN